MLEELVWCAECPTLKLQAAEKDKTLKKLQHRDIFTKVKILD